VTAAETTVPGPLLSEDDRAGLATLLADVDSVELKLTVPEGDQRSTVGRCSSSTRRSSP